MVRLHSSFNYRRVFCFINRDLWEGATIILMEYYMKTRPWRIVLFVVLIVLPFVSLWYRIPGFNWLGEKFDEWSIPLLSIAIGLTLWAVISDLRKRIYTTLLSHIGLILLCISIGWNVSQWIIYPALVCIVVGGFLQHRKPKPQEGITPE